MDTGRTPCDQNASPLCEREHIPPHKAESAVLRGAGSVCYRLGKALYHQGPIGQGWEWIKVHWGACCHDTMHLSMRKEHTNTRPPVSPNPTCTEGRVRRAVPDANCTTPREPGDVNRLRWRPPWLANRKTAGHFDGTAAPYLLVAHLFAVGHVEGEGELLGDGGGDFGGGRGREGGDVGRENGRFELRGRRGAPLREELFRRVLAGHGLLRAETHRRV